MKMQILRYIRQRNPKNSSATTSFSTTTTSPPSTTATSPNRHPFSLLPSTPPPKSTDTLNPSTNTLNSNDIVSSFKAWFLTRNNPFLEQIFNVLRTQEGSSLDSCMKSLNLHLTQDLVLEVLNYNKNSPDVLSCLKFFDWAGGQKGFYHTGDTFSALFRILCRNDCMPVMLDVLKGLYVENSVRNVGFHRILVIGYCVAGKPETAVEVFGRMRFQGMDLDSFGYNVLLNALVEEGGEDDEVEMVVQQIRLRGKEDVTTHSIVMKYLCRKREFDKAEEYLRGLPRGGLNGDAIAEFVDALCKEEEFRRAVLLVEDLKKSCDVAMGPVYEVWGRYLIKTGKLGGALEFWKDKRVAEDYIPGVFRYNSIVNKLLQENRLEEVFELLMEMKEQCILPDELTMNSVLCFFCKAGKVDFAMKLYDSRAEFGMSVSSMTFDCLINALVSEVSVDEAFRVFKTAIEKGYNPSEKAIFMITDSLSRDGKPEKMKNLVLVALENNFELEDSTYSNFISAFCRARRVEDGYTLHGYLNKFNKVTSRTSYHNLIKGFSEANRGDIAARLLIEMQEKGHVATRLLFRAVISSLCNMENSEVQVLRFLKMQLDRHEPSTKLFNYFIDVTGDARKPEISRKVYEIMRRAGISPDFCSHALMLNSYVKSQNIRAALIFFRGLPEERRTSGIMWSFMIVDLCNVKRLDCALDLYWKMRANGMRTTLLCYEKLVQLICQKRIYSLVFRIIDDMAGQGHRISTFIGNVLLLHCLFSRRLYHAWVHSKNTENRTPSDVMLGELIGSFSGCMGVSQDFEELEELVKQCFEPDLYSYNMLLRRLTMTKIDHASEYVNRIREKGYEPNKWTYNFLVEACYKHGKDSEARKWRDMMFRKGSGLCESSQLLLS